MGRIAIFIDGAYLDYVLQDEFKGQLKVDYARLAQKITQDHELLRTYYYHCLPYRSDPPTAQENHRYNKAQGFFSYLNKLSRFEVKLGQLSYRGKDQQGKPILEQKRVDLMLGLDLALLGTKGRITHAAVVAGDSDFIPAIEVAKDEGVLIHLYHGAKPHNQLMEAVDERQAISQDYLTDVLRSTKSVQGNASSKPAKPV